MNAQNPFAVGASLAPSEILDRLRSQTCYRVLRALIDIFGVCLSLSFLYAALMFWRENVFRDDDGTFHYGGRLWLLIPAIPLAVTMIIGWRQAALLMIDIADCQIQQLARSRK